MTQEKQGLLSGLTGPKFVETDDVSVFGLQYSILSLHKTNVLYLSPSQWFNQKNLTLDSLESQLKGLTKSIDISSRSRLGKDQSWFLARDI